MQSSQVRNLEYKARVGDLNVLSRRAREVGADLWGDLRQTDTYFVVPKGRLKLRETVGYQAELIFYERDESSVDRPSDYDVARSSEPDVLRAVLSSALGVRAVVRKRRTLLVLDTTRIHLDNVEGLGTFLEIEVPVRETTDIEAKRKLDALLDDLGLRWNDCIRASYVDLMMETKA